MRLYWSQCRALCSLLEVVISVLELYSMVYYTNVKVVAVVLSCNSSMHVVIVVSNSSVRVSIELYCKVSNCC